MQEDERKGLTWCTARGLSAKRVEFVTSTTRCNDELCMISYLIDNAEHQRLPPRALQGFILPSPKVLRWGGMLVIEVEWNVDAGLKDDV